MKEFIDQVFIPGFAFKLTGKFLWDSLLKGRSSRFVVTMGNYRLVYLCYFHQEQLHYGTI
ncbi:MAG: NAD(P)H-dependent oxidoreductase [Candidatus Heimdallarchaeota archaeon]